MAQAHPIEMVVGLGNPGREYEGTRHNAGFDVLSRVLAKLPGTFEETHRAQSRCFAGRFRGRRLLLQMPLTFMNASGEAVACLARREGVEPAAIMVVSDDLDLPPGRLRLRRGGASGGHHGIESIIGELGSADFLRLKVGIGHVDKHDTVDHVLTGFTGEDAEIYHAALDAAAEAVTAVLAAGEARAMTQFNAFNAAEKKEEKTTVQEEAPAIKEVLS